MQDCVDHLVCENVVCLYQLQLHVRHIAPIGHMADSCVARQIVCCIQLYTYQILASNDKIAAISAYLCQTLNHSWQILVSDVKSLMADTRVRRQIIHG